MPWEHKEGVMLAYELIVNALLTDLRQLLAPYASLVGEKPAPAAAPAGLSNGGQPSTPAKGASSGPVAAGTPAGPTPQASPWLHVGSTSPACGPGGTGTAPAPAALESTTFIASVLLSED